MKVGQGSGGASFFKATVMFFEVQAAANIENSAVIKWMEEKPGPRKEPSLVFHKIIDLFKTIN